MDTSKTYIKMCEKAEEIQEQWKWSGIYREDSLLLIQGIAHSGDDVLFQEGRKHIWLPRQDQLQEMVALDGHWMELDFDEGKIKASWHDFISGEGFLSMEQLWLAFVMKKYNKVWNGEAWAESL